MDRQYEAAYFDERLRNRLYETVVKALEEVAAEEKLKKKDIAERSGKKPSQISYWLSGPGNWTLDTVARLLFAIDAELDFKVTRFKDKQKENQFHDLNSPTISLVQTNATGTTTAPSSTAVITGSLVP